MHFPLHALPTSDIVAHAGQPVGQKLQMTGDGKSLTSHSTNQDFSWGVGGHFLNSGFRQRSICDSK